MMNDIRAHLLSMKDEEYKKFHSALMPTIDPDSIIGIRVPALRKYAKELYKSKSFEDFLTDLPHKYYEENNIHAFLVEQEKDYDVLIERINAFLPYVDNWATCDMLSPKILKKYKKELLSEIEKWLNSDKTYTIRFGIKCLMQYYLDEDFEVSFAQKVADVKSEEYYVNMMRAWYFATALSKQYEISVKVLENRSLDRWTHNKTISKACESYRISPDIKAYLKTLRY